MQNIYAKLHKTLQNFKTLEQFFDDIYAILHKLPGNEEAEKMLTSVISDTCPFLETRTI